MTPRRYWPVLPSSPKDWELTSILVARPVAAVLLYPVRDSIHPNTVTILSLLLYLTGVWFLWKLQLVAAAVLLFVGMVLDDGDGLLARYQGRASLLGSYLDKMADVIRFWALFSVVGLHAYRATGDPWQLYLAGMAAFGLMVQGYTKWIVDPFLKERIIEKTNTEQNSLENQGFWKGVLVAVLWPFHECDLTIWAMVLPFFWAWGMLNRVLAYSQLVAAVIAMVARLVAVLRDSASTHE